MRKSGIIASLLILAIVPVYCSAQEKAKAEEKSKTEEKGKAAAPSTPVKLQIVFTEFDGDKKVKSLPYVMYINVPHGVELQPGWTKLRIGSRVPVYAGSGQAQYIDVGTNIDNRLVRNDEGRFRLVLNLERSWVDGEMLVSADDAASKRGEDASGAFKDPVIRQFKSEVDLSLRDGQTIETIMATDPLSGKVLHVEVTLNVIK